MTQNGDKGKGCYPCTPRRYGLDEVATRLPGQGGFVSRGARRSPHPFIARIPLPGSFLLPLLIALLLFLLLGTAPSPIVALFLIQLPFVGRGLVGV
jgi:hypothetical protein